MTLWTSPSVCPRALPDLACSWLPRGPPRPQEDPGAGAWAAGEGPPGGVDEDRRQQPSLRPIRLSVCPSLSLILGKPRAGSGARRGPVGGLTWAAPVLRRGRPSDPGEEQLGTEGTRATPHSAGMCVGSL